MLTVSEVTIWVMNNTDTINDYWVASQKSITKLKYGLTKPLKSYYALSEDERGVYEDLKHINELKSILAYINMRQEQDRDAV